MVAQELRLLLLEIVTSAPNFGKAGAEIMQGAGYAWNSLAEVAPPTSQEITFYEGALRRSRERIKQAKDKSHA
jgi:hypothetical protein